MQDDVDVKMEHTFHGYCQKKQIYIIQNMEVQNGRMKATDPRIQSILFIVRITQIY